MKSKILKFVAIICFCLSTAMCFSACGKKVTISVYVGDQIVETITTTSKENFKASPSDLEDITTNPDVMRYFCGWYIDENFETPLTSDTIFNENGKIFAKFIDVDFDNFEYTLNNNEATITSFDNKNNEELVIIPAKINSYNVKVIGELAFSNQTLVKTIIMCDGIETMETMAFKNCTNLQTLKLSNILKTIKSKVFEGCQNLTKIDLPKSVTTIENQVFSGAINLKTLNYQGDFDTWSTNQLAKSEILSDIDTFILGNQEITHTLEIPLSVEEIKEYAFYGFKTLKTLKTTNTTKINQYAFANCLNLVQLDIGEKLTQINSNAFFNCVGLKNVVIPDNVLLIELGAFSGCGNIESMTLPFVGEQRLYDVDNQQLYPLGFVFGSESYENSIFVEGIIGDFYYVPQGLKTITLTSNANVHGHAFYNCSNIETVYLPETVKVIGYSAFENCTSLKNIKIPRSVTTIFSKAFTNCDSLEEVIIPKEVINMGNRCSFDDCAKIKIFFETTTIPSYWRLDKWSEYNIPLYVYAEEKPTSTGNYWCYVDNQIKIWE